MKHKRWLIPALSTLFLSTTVLSQAVYANEAELATEPVAAASAAEEVAQDQAVAANSAESVAQDSTLDSTTTADVSNDATAVTESVATTAEVAEPVLDTTTDTSSVTILHTNDIHGRIEESNGVIGVAKLATVVEQARAEGTTLVLDAGDAFQGMPISNSTKGEDMAAIMNEIGYDAMAVGNHEFDFGFDQAIKYTELLNFPLLSANVYANDVRVFEASTIIDKTPDVDGDEIVVIGVTTPETATKTHPNNVIGVTFKDPVTEVNSVISEVEAKGRANGRTYNTYIVLGHLGVDQTTPLEWQGGYLAEELSKNPELAGKTVIVIDGHSHTLATATYGNVTYNQTGSYLNNIGKITLNSAEVLSAGVITAEEAKAVEANPAIAAKVQEIAERFAAANAVVIRDSSPVELNGDRENVRVRETNLGNVVADALYQYAQTGFAHPADLAVTNGGGLRATIAKDQPITVGDTIAVLPFGNIISQIEVTGQDIYDMYTHALGGTTQVDADGNPVVDDNGNPLLEATGGFLHTSGAVVFYDTNLPKEERVLDIYLVRDGQYVPVDRTATYYLATNDFLAAGGDGFTMLGGAREEGVSLDEVFAEYLKTADLTLDDYAVTNPATRLISIDSSLDADGNGVADAIENFFAASAGQTPIITDENAQPSVLDNEMITTETSQTVSEQGQTASTIAYHSSRLNVSSASAVAQPKETLSRVAKHKALPETGENSSMLSLLGMSALGLVTGLVNRRRKEH